MRFLQNDKVTFSPQKAKIYATWKAGLTQDPRFGGLILGIHELSKMAIKAIERGIL